MLSPLCRPPNCAFMVAFGEVATQLPGNVFSGYSSWLPD